MPFECSSKESVSGFLDTRKGPLLTAKPTQDEDYAHYQQDKKLDL